MKGLHAHHPRDCLYHLRDWHVPRLHSLLQVSASEDKSSVTTCECVCLCVCNETCYTTCMSVQIVQNMNLNNEFSQLFRYLQLYKVSHPLASSLRDDGGPRGPRGNRSPCPVCDFIYLFISRSVPCGRCVCRDGAQRTRQCKRRSMRTSGLPRIQRLLHVRWLPFTFSMSVSGKQNVLFLPSGCIIKSFWWS